MTLINTVNVMLNFCVGAKYKLLESGYMLLIVDVCTSVYLNMKPKI